MASLLGGAVLAACVSGVACGGGAQESGEPEAPRRGAAADAKRRDFVQGKLRAARVALRDGQPGKARGLANEAHNKADTEGLKGVYAVLEEIDKYEAEQIAAEVRQLAKGRKCADGMETVAAEVKKAQSKAFREALRAATDKHLVECVRADIDEAIAKGEFVFARTMIELPAAAIALGEEAWKELAGKLHKAIVEKLSAKIDADVKAGKYEAAVKTITEHAQKGEIGPEDEQGALDTIRAVVAPKQAQQVDAAIGGKGKPEAALAELDEMAKLLRWTLPDDLRKARAALAAWVECSRLKCTAPKPEARWTYGRTEVRPSEASGGKPAATWPTGKKVWQVAKAGAFALVSEKEPAADAPIKDRLIEAAGWVSADRVKAEDTADWILPGDEVKGQRVFAPLRAPDKLYYMGIVAAVQGNDVTVQRLADDQQVTVPRATLRSGRLAPGTQILTWCKDQIRTETAKIEKEIPQVRGLPLARIVCPGEGVAPRDEVLGAIKTKPEWLPPRKEAK